MSKNVTREVASIVSQLKQKLGINLVAIVQIGSSLRPREMVEESDIDFVVVTKRKIPWKRRIRVDSSYETNILDYSGREFKRLLAKGEPVPLMTVKFGRIWFGRKWIVMFGEPKATNYTSERWHELGLRVYSMAIAEYFSGSCVCCYLKDCHHAIRSLLRAQIVRNKNLLCETDDDIINNTDDAKLGKLFVKLRQYRKKPSRILLSIYSSEKAMCGLHGRAAKPLLIAENIIHKIVAKVERKNIYSFADIIMKARHRRPNHRIHSIWLSTREEGCAEYLVTLFNKKNKISHIHLPFYTKTFKFRM